MIQEIVTLIESVSVKALGPKVSSFEDKYCHGSGITKGVRIHKSVGNHGGCDWAALILLSS